MLPIVILTITMGGPFLFAAFLGAVSAIATYEFYRMALPDRRLELSFASLCSVLVVIIPLYEINLSFLSIVIGCLFSLFLLFLFRIRDITNTAREVSYAILGFIYIPVLLAHLVMLRQTVYGIQWLLVIMLIVMTNDSLAFYSGKTFGKHRLYPLVSPKKTIEGAAGGLVGSIIGAELAKYTFFPQLSAFDVVFTAIFIGIIGQIGDLFESMLKRGFGVKDSGGIMPGHGGILDRMDSIIFAAPATYYYVIYCFKG